jgi:hypothetical protein
MNINHTDYVDLFLLVTTLIVGPAVVAVDLWKQRKR